MDSTHNTNHLGWVLFTIMVRSGHGRWLPCAHMLCDHEDGDIIGVFLRQVKIWCGGRGRWRLRYFITDDSPAEQRAVQLAFRGLNDGEQEVDHFLCRKHSERTLKMRLAGPAYAKACKHLYSALYFRKTRMGCEESIQAAIDAAPNQEKRDYIYKEWWKTRHQWAYYARQHSCLLLQVPTTNPVEGWHSSLKKHAEGKRAIRKFSLAGTATHGLRIGDQWERRAQEAAVKWRSYQSAECADYPLLRRFPGPIQDLIVTQIKKAQSDTENGEKKIPSPIPQISSPQLIWS